MSASLSQYFRKVPRRILPFIAWGITDETFAISIGPHMQGEADHHYSLVLHYTAFASWVGGTVAGSFAGYLVPQALQSSLEFALYSMFVGLVVLQVSGRLHVAVAVAAALMATAFSSFMGGTWHVITAAILGATLGMILESSTIRRNGDTAIRRKFDESTEPENHNQMENDDGN
jgi:predicted branched-subunit amino acid permease